MYMSAERGYVRVSVIVFLAGILTAGPARSQSTSPAVTCPGDAEATATGPDGAVVTYAEAVVTDPDPGDAGLDADCVPASGSLFPLGTTRVECTATDSAGNKGLCGFDVTVSDETPPTVTCPADLVLSANEAGQAVGVFAVDADDDVDASPAAVCSPASGSAFPIGTTTVTCTATDDAGNQEDCSFRVTVNGCDLSVAMVASPDPVTVGEKLVYRVNVANGGSSPAKGVALVEALPDGLDFVSVQTTAGACVQGGGTVMCDLGTMGAGTTAMVVVVAKPTRADPLLNTASVTTGSVETNTANNAAAVEVVPLLPDGDKDGIPDMNDNCPASANADQADGDADGIGNACDNAPNRANSDQLDQDGDGVGDVVDNCPLQVNPGQGNRDEDGFGDVCDWAPDDPTLPIPSTVSGAKDSTGSGGESQDGDEDEDVTLMPTCGIICGRGATPAVVGLTFCWLVVRLGRRRRWF